MDVQRHRAWTDSPRSARTNGERHLCQQRHNAALDRLPCRPSRAQYRLPLDQPRTEAGVSTYPIAPGQGVVFDAIIPQPGKYPIVNHNMRDMMIGAAGELQVTP